MPKGLASLKLKKGDVKTIFSQDFSNKMALDLAEQLLRHISLPNYQTPCTPRNTSSLTRENLGSFSGENSTH